MFVEYNHTDRGGQNDVCPKIILTHAQFRKKDECDTKLCDMIQAFDEQLPERDNDIIKIFLLLSAQIYPCYLLL